MLVKGSFSGTFTNLTRSEQDKFRKIVSEHYNYTKNGADFTADMLEKSSHVSLKPPVKLIESASKKLQMGNMEENLTTLNSFKQSHLG